MLQGIVFVYCHSVMMVADHSSASRRSRVSVPRLVTLESHSCLLRGRCVCVFGHIAGSETNPEPLGLSGAFSFVTCYILSFPPSCP